MCDDYEESQKDSVKVSGVALDWTRCFVLQHQTQVDAVSVTLD